MRTETKYQIDRKAFEVLKSLLSSYFDKDPHSGEDGYLVSSLYYDSEDLKSYYEKAEGDTHKTKWRLRTYNQNSESIRLEQKTKTGRFSTKAFFEEEHLRTLPLRPKLAVEYKRLAFQEGSHRFTLDFDIRFARLNERSGFLVYPTQTSDLMILEVKSKEGTHPIIEKLIKQLDLKSTSLSKYGYGMPEHYGL